MARPVYNCERRCKNNEPITSTELIVLTGGPGAGKTAVLEFVRKLFCEHTAILPEAASILFSGGFWRLDSVSARKAEQRAIYYVQNEMQNLVIAEKKWTVGLCDRGTLDGLAYWPNSEKSFLETLDTKRETEFAKYKAVIHLRSPSSELGYNHQNPIRTETPEMAAEIDQKIKEAWQAHPNYVVVESTNSFIEKLHLATKQIQHFLPASCCGHLANV